MATERPEIRPAILLLAAGALSAVAFLPSFSGPWIFDDHTLIATNPYVHSFSSWTRWFTTDFWNVNAETVRANHHLLYWRPAINATYALDWTLGSGSPVFFHAMNLLWQAVMGALAFHVLKRWIGAPVPALVAAVLFAVHPTKAESVAWIAGRTDVLCMIFVLVAAEGMARRRRGARGGIAIEISATLAAYLCKEQAIVLPVFAMVEAWVSRDRAPLDRATLRAMIVAAIPQIVVALAYLAIRAVLLPIGFEATSPPLPTHALAVLESFGRFTALMVAPHDLSIHHGIVHTVHGLEISAPYVALGAITIIALGALVLAFRRRAPEISIALGLYALTILPTSNLKYTHMQSLVAERFLYLPSLGIALLVGFALARATPAWRRPAYGLAIAIAIALGALSLSRSADFQDEAQFWGHEIALYPDSGPSYDGAIEVAITRRDYRDALALMAVERREANALDRDAGSELSRAVLTARVSALLVPDGDQARLRSIDQFCATLLSNAPSTLVLAEGTLVVDPRDAVKAGGDAELAILALRTELAARLGDDARAVELGERVFALCPTCISSVPVASIALAAAGKYDRADAILGSLHGYIDETTYQLLFGHLRTGRAAHAAWGGGIDPDALRARATELSALELWGRAYAVLAPYLSELEHAPRFAVGVAELAFRAGESTVARRLLLAAAPLTDVDVTFRQWSASMGWQ